MKTFSTLLVSLIIIVGLTACSSSRSTRSGGGVSTAANEAAPLRQGVQYLQRHLGMVNAGDACDRSNAWFVQTVYEQVNEGGAPSGDEGGFTGGATPGISTDDDAIELPIAGTGWPASVHLAFNKPSHPWTVVVRRDLANKQIVADGYGDSIDKALFTETLKQ